MKKIAISSFLLHKNKEESMLTTHRDTIKKNTSNNTNQTTKINVIVSNPIKISKPLSYPYSCHSNQVSSPIKKLSLHSIPLGVINHSNLKHHGILNPYLVKSLSESNAHHPVASSEKSNPSRHEIDPNSLIKLHNPQIMIKTKTNLPTISPQNGSRIHLNLPSSKYHPYNPLKSIIDKSPAIIQFVPSHIKRTSTITNNQYQNQEDILRTSEIGKRTKTYTEITKTNLKLQPNVII